MLILTRGPAQALIIGGDITLTVLNIKGDRVRIGINAPDDVIVQRPERRLPSPPIPASTTGR
jgi:carbon storage regulator